MKLAIVCGYAGEGATAQRTARLPAGAGTANAVLPGACFICESASPFTAR